MEAPVRYIPNFLSDPDAVLLQLTALDWERRDGTPRSEYYINDYPEPYTYGAGRGRRTYLPKPKPPEVASMQDALRALTGHLLEVCFLNRYLDQKDQLGWHADDSPEMDDLRPIAVVSLGAEREIWFRPKDERPTMMGVPLGDPKIEKLRLQHGSLCLMAAGMQDTHQHRIPKSDRTVGQRISLTFRGYVRNP